MRRKILFSVAVFATLFLGSCSSEGDTDLVDITTKADNCPSPCDSWAAKILDLVPNRPIDRLGEISTEAITFKVSVSSKLDKATYQWKLIEGHNENDAKAKVIQTGTDQDSFTTSHNIGPKTLICTVTKKESDNVVCKKVLIRKFTVIEYINFGQPLFQSSTETRKDLYVSLSNNEALSCKIRIDYSGCGANSALYTEMWTPGYSTPMFKGSEISSKTVWYSSLGSNRIRASLQVQPREDMGLTRATFTIVELDTKNPYKKIGSNNSVMLSFGYTDDY